MTTWQQRYTTILDGIWTAYEDNDLPDADPASLAALVGIATEIRAGLDAGLLDGDTVPTRPDCPHCPHPYADHSEQMGCVHGAGDSICQCGNTRAVLVAINNALANRGR